MILITGATGTNGRFVVQALLEAGARVRAMVQDPAKGADLAQRGAELAAADFDKPETRAAAPALSAACCSLRSISDSSSGKDALSKLHKRPAFAIW
jgi:uncharacterized protein YbjT (DUF2867 family)